MATLVVRALELRSLHYSCALARGRGLARAPPASGEGLSASIPGVIQDGYATLDANVRLRTADGRWQLAFIGKNLTDKLAFRGAGDIPETGGNTGTAEGFRGDYSGGAIRPRQLELELTYRM